MQTPGIIAPEQDTLHAFGRLIHRVTDPRLPIAATVLEVLGDLRAQYRVFHIPKGDGRTRTIESPQPKLRFLQDLLHKRLLSRIRLPEEVYGFRTGTGAYKGLRRMADNIKARDDGKGELQSVYQVDLKDFFPNTTCEMATNAVQKTLERVLRAREETDDRPARPQLLPDQMIERVSQLIAQLCCIPDPERGTLRLPQGSPTSPALANMVAARRFDPVIVREIGENFEYGRYADDIVILGTEPMRRETRDKVIAILTRAGYPVAHGKTEYGEDEDKYRIWGVDLMPADKDGDIRFHLPRTRPPRRKGDEERDTRHDTKERAYRNELLRVIGGGTIDRKKKHGRKPFNGPPALDVTDPRAFMDHPDVQRVLGNLSHAYVVTLFGRDTERRRKTGEHEPLLPAEVQYAWGKFREAFGDRLPEGHPGWFTGFLHKRVMRRQPDVRIDATNAAETLDTRLRRLAEIRGIDYEKLLASLGQERAKLVKAYPLREPDGQQYGLGKGKKPIYPDGEIVADVREFLGDYPTLKPPAKNKKMLALLLRHTAYVQLRLDGTFGGYDLFHREKGKDTGSILSEDMALPWEKLTQHILKQEEYSLLRGCRYFFRDIQRGSALQDVWTPQKPKNVRKKTFLYFPGLEDEA